MQRRYEALKAFYCDQGALNDILKQFGFTSSYFKKVRSEFMQSLKNEINPFFDTKKTGPKSITPGKAGRLNDDRSKRFDASL